MTSNNESDAEVNSKTPNAEEDGAAGNLETNWTIPATSRFLELVEERKRRIIETQSQECATKLRYEDWHPISKKLQLEGFMYSGASCQRKYINMKKSYFNNKKLVENRKKIAARLNKPVGQIQVVWPFFFRFAALFDDVPDPDVVIRARGTAKPKSRRDVNSIYSSEGEDDDGDEDEDEEDEGGRSKKHHQVKSKFNKRVSDAIHTLLKSEPVIILDDPGAANKDVQAEPEEDYSGNLIHEAGKTIIKQEPSDDDHERDIEDGTDDATLLRRLKRRKLQVVIPRLPDDDYQPKLPAKRARKSRVRYSPDSDACRSADEHDSPQVSKPRPTPKVKTFSLRSSVSDEALAEIKYLRGDVARVNRNLEDLVNSHNQLIDNFEKLFKFMVKRFK